MRTLRRLIAWGWTLGVFAVCWTPRALVPVENGPVSPLFYGHLDKVVHFLLFAGFGFFWKAAVNGRAGLVFGAGVAAAVLSELGQLAPIVNRDAEWADSLADVLGVVGGIGVYYAARVLFPARSRSAAVQPTVKVPSAERP